MQKMGRLLLQELARHQRRDPCLRSSLNISAAATQNASRVCHHAYGYVHHHEGSPIPYLLAGLAAMLALIAISLFILACSYWKLVGCVEQQHAAARDYNSTPNTATSSAPHPAQSSNHVSNINIVVDTQEDHSSKVVVIMAGHDKPTYLAQPVGNIVDANMAASNLKV